MTTSFEQIRERVSVYQEEAMPSELLKLVFPRVSSEILEKLDRHTFLEMVNMKKEDFAQLGLTKSMADKFEKMMFFFKRLRFNESSTVEVVGSPEAVYNVFSFLESNLVEEFWVIYLNVKNEVIKKKKIFSGGLNSSIVHPREIYREAVNLPVASIICAHNHPSGNPNPSPEDLEVTKRLVLAGEIMGIECLDHVIVGRNRYYSLKEEGHM